MGRRDNPSTHAASAMGVGILSSGVAISRPFHSLECTHARLLFGGSWSNAARRSYLATRQLRVVRFLFLFGLRKHEEDGSSPQLDGAGCVWEWHCGDHVAETEQGNCRHHSFPWCSCNPTLMIPSSPLATLFQSGARIKGL